MKLYPKHNVPEHEAGFTAEEIRRGQHLLNIDVTCTNPDCRKVHALSNTRPDCRCVRCGSKCE